jgi:hypothetical protein
VAFDGLGQDFQTWTPKQTTLYTLRRGERASPHSWCHVYYDLPGRSVSEVRKGVPFGGCFDLVQAPRVNASWSLPPGADSIPRK